MITSKQYIGKLLRKGLCLKRQTLIFLSDGQASFKAVLMSDEVQTVRNILHLFVF